MIDVVVGEIFVLPLKRLHPTQFAIGLREVLQRAKKLKKMGSKRLFKLLSEDPIPVVIGPKGVIYLIDHHHLALALHKAQCKKVMCVVQANWTDMPMGRFWHRMHNTGWLHPFDENGAGPLHPAKLPRTVLGLKDDPYRSLAWAVRKEGGFCKSNAPFSDFRWATFFRLRLEIDPQKHFKKSLKVGLKLAQSRAARGMPGYVGQKSLRLLQQSL